MHPIISSEGVILRMIPFKDYHQIVTLFTPLSGLIKIFYRGNASLSKKGSFVPLTKVEVAYKEKNGEIFSCFGLNCIDSFRDLRQQFSFLEVGCELLQGILDSQLAGKEAPLIYALLLSYLKKIPLISNPSILSASFELKLLKHDGLLHVPFSCTECGERLEEGYIHGIEKGCTLHRPPGSQFWEAFELNALYQLAETQSFLQLSQIEVSPFFREKISRFFRSSCQQ